MQFLRSFGWTQKKYQQCAVHPDASDDDDESQPLHDKDFEGSSPAPCYCSHPRPWVFHNDVFQELVAAAWLFRERHQLLLDPAPVYDRLDIYRSEIRHNFSNYWPDNRPSIFQQMPSPEVDAAWERISDQESIPLSADEVRKLGYDPDTVWPAPKDEFGEGVYYGVVDVFHQIHCLNMMRHSAFPAYYGDVRERTKHVPLKWDDHLLHCQYAVLRALMCHADVEVQIGQKFKGWPGLNMNFASTKSCRDFEQILDWKEANVIKQKAPWSEYPDVPIIEQDPEGVLTPYGNHLGLEDYADSQGITLKIPTDLAWQPTHPHHQHNTSE
ncbi:hypothetical protein BO71DRAFT_443520 [Aspergillus ellipticus CBS 707.79]|uniref:Tat pathway signal sequence n=1 Tax=Aspergillus ellipticus CBS 707.79 TaxID=1448320 RepID=A0A319DIH6_9EURO|nr:hypothetical protein BO71DRAFT_443520 [Aspergillus ellipticus CBS 707.79]